MIKQYSKIYILFLFSFSVNAQDVSQYQTELDMLPDSVRSSVFERMSETDFPEENTPPSTAEIFTDNRLDRYDLLNSDYDRYGSVIPKPLDMISLEIIKRPDYLHLSLLQRIMF